MHVKVLNCEIIICVPLKATMWICHFCSSMFCLLATRSVGAWVLVIGVPNSVLNRRMICFTANRTTIRSLIISTNYF